MATACRRDGISRKMYRESLPALARACPRSGRWAEEEGEAASLGLSVPWLRLRWGPHSARIINLRINLVCRLLLEKKQPQAVDQVGRHRRWPSSRETAFPTAALPLSHS